MDNNFIYEAAEKAALNRKTAGSGATPHALHDEVTFFPLAKAVLCGDCENVSNGVTTCPACGSSALMNISKTLGGGTGGTLEGAPASVVE
jgi:hypothetical protein